MSQGHVLPPSSNASPKANLASDKPVQSRRDPNKQVEVAFTTITGSGNPKSRPQQPDTEVAVFVRGGNDQRPPIVHTTINDLIEKANKEGPYVARENGGPAIDIFLG